jgi:glycosyltransferase involved in cell wall biosynthesis
MFSGKPLVVDNRGGWQTMIEHGHSGFLCNHERDFIYYGSRLAYDFDLRMKIAENARQRAIEMASLEVSRESWKKIFESVFN